MTIKYKRLLNNELYFMCCPEIYVCVCVCLEVNLFFFKLS